MQFEAPGSATEPGAQRLHARAPALDTDPALQLPQLVLPANALNAPALHKEHAVLPAAAVKEPGTHAWHALAPGEARNEPGKQTTHDV